MFVKMMSKVARMRNEIRIPVPWGHIAGISWGDPQDKKVLMVHGSQDNAESFTRLVKYLPQNYFYLSIDLPGHGLSSHFQRGTVLNFLDFVLAIRYVLDELSWDNCLYIGHSFGGQVGAMHSIICPDRVEKLVAIDALMCIAFSKEQVLNRIRAEFDLAMQTARKPESLYTREDAFERLGTKRPFKLIDAATEVIFDRATTKVGDKYKFNRDPRLKPVVGLHFDVDTNVEFLQNLRTPTLFLQAASSYYDFVKEQYALDIYEKVAPSCFTIRHLEGNHEVHTNDPKLVAAHITEFFEPKSKL